MNKNERELFLELCAYRAPRYERIEALLRGGAATPCVLGTLFANRVAAIAYGVLSEGGMLGLADREFRNSLRCAWAFGKMQNKDMLLCIKSLCDSLEASGIPYALLKGAYLCYAYPEGYRTSNDIDVLVSPEDVGRVCACLKRAGFEQGYLKNGEFVPATREQIISSRMMRGETVPFIKEVGLPSMQYLEVDVNFSLDLKSTEDTALRKMLSRAIMTPIADTRIRTLETYDFILHLCAHLYKEAASMPWIRMRRDMSFYKYCDIYGMLFSMSDGELDMLYLRAEELGIKKELIYCLASLDAFFGTAHLRERVTENELCYVSSPSDKKTYRYTQSDPVERFFCEDRIRLLSEVRDERA